MNGLLIDYEFCYGCHTCEAACKKEHNLPKGQWGIELHEMGPRLIGEDKWEFTYVPVPTELCDLCAERVDEGRLPTCVHHCLAKVIEYGPVEELAKKLAEKPKMVLYSVQQ